MPSQANCWRKVEHQEWVWAHDYFKKHVNSMSSALEPAKWSCDTGQRMPCFDSCQFTMIWQLTRTIMQARSIIRSTGNQRAPCSPTPYAWTLTPWAREQMPLTGMTMKNDMHMGFLFLCMVIFGLPNFYRYGTSLLRPFGLPKLRFKVTSSGHKNNTLYHLPRRLPASYKPKSALQGPTLLNTWTLLLATWNWEGVIGVR